MLGGGGLNFPTCPRYLFCARPRPPTPDLAPSGGHLGGRHLHCLHPAPTQPPLFDGQGLFRLCHLSSLRRALGYPRSGHGACLSPATLRHPAVMDVALMLSMCLPGVTVVVGSCACTAMPASTRALHRLDKPSQGASVQRRRTTRRLQGSIVRPALVCAQVAPVCRCHPVLCCPCGVACFLGLCRAYTGCAGRPAARLPERAPSAPTMLPGSPTPRPRPAVCILH